MSDSRALLEANGVARAIRDAFYHQKAVRMNRRYKPTPRHDSFDYWLAAAELAMELEADPEVFVETAFTNCRIKGGPFPNSLGGPAMRGWWARYRGTLSAAAQIATPQEALQEPEIRTMTTAEMDLASDIELAEISMRHVTGAMEHRSPQGLDFLRCSFYPVAPYVRVFLSFPDDAVRKEFGSQALDSFEHRPSLLKAARGLGFPVDKIVRWLRE